MYIGEIYFYNLQGFLKLKFSKFTTCNRSSANKYLSARIWLIFVFTNRMCLNLGKFKNKVNIIWQCVSWVWIHIHVDVESLFLAEGDCNVFKKLLFSQEYIRPITLTWSSNHIIWDKHFEERKYFIVIGEWTLQRSS